MLRFITVDKREELAKERLFLFLKRVEVLLLHAEMFVTRPTDKDATHTVFLSAQQLS
jgi:hypothetical protein